MATDNPTSRRSTDLAASAVKCPDFLLAEAYRATLEGSDLGEDELRDLLRRLYLRLEAAEIATTADLERPTPAMLAAGALAFHLASSNKLDATDGDIIAVWDAMNAARA